MADEWYFVRQLRDTENPSSTLRFEIQVLDEDGRAVFAGYLSSEMTELEINKQIVPVPVLEAAKSKEMGRGDYVDSEGKTVVPY
jgi:hypothetical protein